MMLLMSGAGVGGGVGGCCRRARRVAVALAFSASRVVSWTTMRVLCSSLLQAWRSTAACTLAGRFFVSSTLGGLGGELHDARSSSIGTTCNLDMASPHEMTGAGTSRRSIWTKSVLLPV